METKRNGKKIIIGVIILIIMVVTLFLAYRIFAQKSETGNKEIMITVFHGNGSDKTFQYKTDLEYLGELLLETNLVEGKETEYGFYMLTVDKESADESKQQWWCITKGGEMVMTGMDQTPIKNRDAYELTLKTGY